MLFAELNKHASQQPNGIALKAVDGRGVTYGELISVLGAISTWLEGLDVQQGRGLAVAMSNGPELALTLLGASRTHTVTPLDPDLTPLELRAILKHVDATAIITDAKHEGILGGVASVLGIPVHVAKFSHGPVLGELEGFQLDPAPLSDPPEDHVMLLHRTSGTTGNSKRVPLRMVNVAAQARNTAESLGLGPADVILQVMPLFHMHGFGCLTGTLWSGGTVIATPGHDGRRYAAWCDTFKPTWFSASPAILSDIAQVHAKHPELAEKVPFRFVRSLSAAISGSLFTTLEQVTGAPVIEQYGLTEALSPVIANHPPPRERRVGAIGRPYRCEVRIVDASGNEVAQGETGEVLLRGAGVFRGYAEADEVNDRSWFGEWFRTGDLARSDEDGFVHLKGRLKEEINRGGEKIDPHEVESALEGHPGITGSAAFAIAHPTLGEEVAIAYIPGEAHVAVDDLRRWMQERMASHKVPKRFIPMESFPRTATGKLKRTELSTMFNTLEPSFANGSDANLLREGTNGAGVKTVERPSDLSDQVPGTYVERSIAIVWGQELSKERVLLDDDFFQLGGDSLSGVRSCARLSEMLEYKVELAQLFRYPTLRELSLAISGAGQRQQWLNLVPIRMSGSLTPLVCVHGDEGNYNLPRLLSDDRPFIGFMHQGEDGLGMRYKSIKSMARHYVNELVDARPDGPYILCGFSAGGVIAYEMAQRLKAMGKEVPLLIFLDSRGPSFNWWFHAPRAKLSGMRSDLWRPRCERYLKNGQAIPYDLRNTYIISTYRSAVERFRPKPYSGEILYVRSSERADEPDGWDHMLTGLVRTEVIKGKHLDILREPRVRDLVRILEKHLSGRGL
jgi:acyl-CoA synthetase (AMP-forming)/AMP-acid ligase II/thioesterase domain-containing protein